MAKKFTPPPYPLDGKMEVSFITSASISLLEYFVSGPDSVFLVVEKCSPICKWEGEPIVNRCILRYGNWSCLIATTVEKHHIAVNVIHTNKFISCLSRISKRIRIEVNGWGAREIKVERLGFWRLFTGMTNDTVSISIEETNLFFIFIVNAYRLKVRLILAG